jgi:hypothetical protein
MPDEDTIAESIRPSMMPRHLRQRAGIELAHQIATALTPIIMGLPPEVRGSEAAVMQAIAGAMTPEVVGALSLALRDVDPGPDIKEVLSGDMSAVPLAELLQLLQMLRQTGVLRVFNNKQTLTISIRQGLVDHVQSRGTADEFRLGRYFVERGVVTREQLDQVLRDRKPGAPVGQAIVDAGLAAKEDLTEVLSRQSSELIYEVLRWPYGRFTFTREPFRAEAESARLGLGVSGLVLEGFRRVDEWRLMESTINFDSVVMVDQVVLDNLGSGQLTRTEQLVLSAVDGTRTVSEIIKESSVGSFDAVKSIYQFLQSRVLRPRAA